MRFIRLIIKETGALKPSKSKILKVSMSWEVIEFFKLKSFKVLFWRLVFFHIRTKHFIVILTAKNVPKCRLVQLTTYCNLTNKITT